MITGEEAESNVLQIQCKLFVFDKTSQSWVERGRGLLRLNDMASTDDGTLQSRLVMRTQGSLRLILNTKLWAQMQIDKASEKSIRITAMDTEDQGVKVFLISASSKDTGQLYAALHHRILALRSRVEQEQEAKTPVQPTVTHSLYRSTCWFYHNEMPGLGAPPVLLSDGTAAQRPHLGSSLGSLEENLWKTIQGKE